MALRAGRGGAGAGGHLAPKRRLVVAAGAPLAIILAATAAGLFIAAIWAAAIGQSAVAGIFGIFAGFWLSYVVLVVGLIHGWFGITPLAAVATQKLFLITWLVIIVMLTLGTLRLPLAFTAVFALIDVALLLLLIATIQASAMTLGAIGVAMAAGGVAAGPIQKMIDAEAAAT